MRFQPNVRTVAAATAGLALMACSPGPGTSSPGPGTSPSAGPASGSPAPSARPATTAGEPQTAAAVRADAGEYLSLYSAGQYAIIYQMLSAQARRKINERAWVAVHEGCPGGGKVYKITRVAVTGRTAVVTAAMAGAAASLAQRETLVYTAGHWGFSPRDLSLYQHGSVAADVAAAHAQGGCAS
jgi:hypothetical protein